MTRDEAEIMALHALSWIAADDEMMARFSALSGMAAGDITEHAGEGETLGALMDFLLSDEEMLTQFCAAHEIAPDRPALARALLPGGDVPHWT